MIKKGDRWLAGKDRSSTAVQAAPQIYIRTGTGITLDPVPDAVYTIKYLYKGKITPLVADADEPVIPDGWDEGIKLLARHKYYDDKGDLQKAYWATNSYREWMRDQPSEIDEESVDIDSAVELPTLNAGLPRYSSNLDEFMRGN